MFLAFVLTIVTGCRSARPKILLVGIDGAEWNIVDRLREQGRLPALDALIRRGTRGKLATITPTLSPAIWNTIATGFPPEQHGISNFVVGIPEAALTLSRLPSRQVHVRFEMRLGPPCSLRKVKIALGREVTRAVADPGGVSVSLPAVAGRRADVVATIRLPARCAAPWTGDDPPSWGTLDRVLVTLPSGRVVASPAVESLVRQPAVVRPHADGRPGGELIGRRYRSTRSTDRRLPALWTIASAQGRAVGVVGWWGTHPAEQVHGTMISDFLLSRDPRRLLTREALLTGATSPPEETARVLASLPDEMQLSAAELATFVPRESSRFEQYLLAPSFVEQRDASPLTTLKNTYLVSRPYFIAARRLLRENQPDALFFYTTIVDAVEHVFWRYYEPDKFPPMPAAEEGEDFADVIPRTYAYVDRELQELIDQAAPDTIVMVVSDHGHHAAPNGEVFSGHHEDGPPGVLVVAGPGIRAAGEVTGASIFDVAPTALVLLGLPVPTDMPGRVLSEIFDHPPRVDNVETYRHLSAPRPDGQGGRLDPNVRERLRALGYL